MFGLLACLWSSFIAANHQLFHPQACLPPQVALLAVASSGVGYVWTQVASEAAGEARPAATNVWFGQAAFQVTGEPGEQGLLGPTQKPSHTKPDLRCMASMQGYMRLRMHEEREMH